MVGGKRGVGGWAEDSWRKEESEKRLVVGTVVSLQGEVAFRAGTCGRSRKQPRAWETSAPEASGGVGLVPCGSGRIGYV